MAAAGRSSAVSEYLMTQRKAFEDLLKTDPQFESFRGLTPGMIDFLVMEKQHLFRVSESRFALVGREKVTGFDHTYTHLKDQTDPESFRPFPIKGVWVPQEEGITFKDHFTPCSSLERQTSRGKEILFLIHPKSERAFASLISRYQPSAEFMAFALSSTRSLLVSFPAKSKDFEYGIVKVSLDETHGEVDRKLSEKECGASVFNSASIRQRPLPLHIFSEDMSFVPHLTKESGGMIFRPLSPLLVRKDLCIAPLYALHGRENLPFFMALCNQMEVSAEDFLETYLIKPLADLWVESLFVHQTSLELHAQNLLLVISTEEKKPLEFLYRDLGGVNRLPVSPEEIPEQYSWSKNHVQDAAKVLEHFAYKVLFNFTKLFFNEERLYSQSPRFLKWKEDMEHCEFDKNWITSKESDEHQREIPLKDFCRYGYFEKRFASYFLDAMASRGLFDLLKMDRESFERELSSPDEMFSQCTQILWFEELIKKAYHPRH